MSYTITITESKEVKEMKSDGYQVVGQTYLSKDQWLELSYDDRKGYKEQDNGQFCKNNYEYPPVRETTKTVQLEVFKQTVEILNMQNVIKAINGLDGRG